MFVYKHTETIEYVKNSLLLKKMQILREKNSSIFRMKNAEISGYYFYVLEQIGRVSDLH